MVHVSQSGFRNLVLRKEPAGHGARQVYLLADKMKQLGLGVTPSAVQAILELFTNKSLSTNVCTNLQMREICHTSISVAGRVC